MAAHGWQRAWKTQNLGLEAFCAKLALFADQTALEGGYVRELDYISARVSASSLVEAPKGAKEEAREDDRRAKAARKGGTKAAKPRRSEVLSSCVFVCRSGAALVQPRLLIRMLTRGLFRFVPPGCDAAL